MSDPSIWIEFCNSMHQDIFNIYGSFNEAIVSFRNESKPAEIIELTSHIDALIESSNSDDDLNKYWQECGSQIIYNNGPIRDFFKMIVTALQGKGDIKF